MVIIIYVNTTLIYNLQQKLIKNILRKIYFNSKQKANISKNIDIDLAKKIINKKKKLSKNLNLYNYNPKLSLIITSYNHSQNIEENYNNIKKYKCDELIVCEDGSIDGSYEKWSKLLQGPNEFLIKTNELNEFFILDRAIRSSKSDIVCVLQDDDIIPADSKWINQSLELFKKHDDLVIIGCNQGYIFDNPEEKFNSFIQICCSDHPNITKNRRNEYLEKKDGNAVFKFVNAINLGPAFIKTDFFRQVGGFNLKKIGAGNPGIHFDWDICLEAQRFNKKVALLNVENIKRRIGGASGLMFDLEKRRAKYKENLEYLNNKYDKDFIKKILL